MIKILKAVLMCLALFFVSNVNAQKDDARFSTEKLAKSDLANGSVRLLIHGGIAPSYFKGQDVFEKKYKLKYRDFGCVVPKDLSIYYYNKEVAKYLDGKYGNKWRTEVRKDIVGI